MAPNIVPLLPRHTVYVEPYCGGAAIMFAKSWPKVTNSNYYREVINDIDGDLVNFYRQLRDNGPELCEKLLLTPHAEEEEAIAKKDAGDPVESARRYYVGVMQCFAHRRGAGWRRSLFSQNDGASYFNAVARLPEYLDRMAGAYITCQDALKIIEQWDSPHTLFYCDPPYPDTCQGHYDGFTVDDFAALVAALEGASGNVMLSCYDVPGVTMPSGWERFEFTARMSARRAVDGGRLDSERTEVVYRRWNTVPVRPEIQDLYDGGAYDCFAFPPAELERREPSLF